MATAGEAATAAPWPTLADTRHVREFDTATPPPRRGALVCRQRTPFDMHGRVRVYPTPPAPPRAIANLRLVGRGVADVERVELHLGGCILDVLQRAPAGAWSNDIVAAIQAARLLGHVDGLPAAVLAHAASFLTGVPGRSTEAQVAACRDSVAPDSLPPGLFAVHAAAGPEPVAPLPFDLVSRGACLPIPVHLAIGVEVTGRYAGPCPPPFPGPNANLALEYDLVEVTLTDTRDVWPASAAAWRFTQAFVQPFRLLAGAGTKRVGPVLLSGLDVASLHVVGAGAARITGGHAAVDGSTPERTRLQRVGPARWRVDFSPPIALSRYERMRLELHVRARAEAAVVDHDDDILVTAAASNLLEYVVSGRWLVRGGLRFVL